MGSKGGTYGSWTVVDVGGNDSDLLRHFTLQGGFRRFINIDPYAPEPPLPNITVVREPWNQQTAAAVLAAHGPAHLITMCNVLAHMPDLHESAAAAATLLHPDGWLLVQAPWSRDLWRYQHYDTVYHEHVYYLGLRAMRRLFQQHWMDVHSVEYLPTVHGGSLRYWLRHGNDGVDESVRRLEDIEAEVPMHGQGRFHNWAADWHERLREAAPVYLIGAAAKATMFLAMTDTAAYVQRVFDDTPAKQGQRLPGTALTVEPLEALRYTGTACRPLLLGAWNHKEALLRRLRELQVGAAILT